MEFLKRVEGTCVQAGKRYITTCATNMSVHTHTSTLPEGKKNQLIYIYYSFFEMFLTFFSGRIVDLKECSGG